MNGCGALRTDCIIWRVIPQPTEWQHIADQIDAAIFVRADFVNKRTRRAIKIPDAHRDDGKRFVLRADEILTAFLELQPAIHGFAVTVSQGECFNDRRTGFASDEVHRI